MSSTRTVPDARDRLAEQVVPGRALPQVALVDPDVFALELDRVFATSWLFAGAAAELPEPGDTLTWTVGRESVLLTRDAGGRLHAHHNVCRHRGSRLTRDGTASAAVVQCPYHSWCYGLDGSLRGAPHMGGSPGADEPDGLALRPVHLRQVAGLVFVCFADVPPPFDAAVQAVASHLDRYRLADTRVAARHRYRVAANWKTLVENNRECYHCRSNHPEFCLSNFDLGVRGDTRSNRRYEAAVAQQESWWAAQGLPVADVSFPDGAPFRVARLPLREGCVTETLSGSLVAPLLGDLTGEHVGSVRVVTLPNCWAHVNADYAMTTRLTPVDAGTTDVDVTFLVRADAVAGTDYDPEELTAVWTATSEQDWELCEANYAGVRSRGYRPGPLSPVTEGSVAAFHAWWRQELGVAAGHRAAGGALVLAG